MTKARPTYWIDTDVLISAKDGPFRFSVAPAFWKSLEEQSRLGRIRISKMVYDEIVKDDSNDDLAKWLKRTRTEGFCVVPDRNVQIKFREIADHVQENYRAHQAAKFLSNADPWIVAHACASGGIVVTHETHQPGAKKVKIPNVCIAMKVAFMNPYDMLEELEITLG